MEHMKLLRNRLESTIGGKVEALQKSIDNRDVQLKNIMRTSMTAMDDEFTKKLDAIAGMQQTAVTDMEDKLNKTLNAVLELVSKGTKEVDSPTCPG